MAALQSTDAPKHTDLLSINVMDYNFALPDALMGEAAVPIRDVVGAEKTW